MWSKGIVIGIVWVMFLTACGTAVSPTEVVVEIQESPAVATAPVTTALVATVPSNATMTNTDAHPSTSVNTNPSTAAPMTSTAPPLTNTEMSNGVAVIGDSGSDPYRPLNRGGPHSFAWTELLRDWRNVNFGPEDAYIVAKSGNVTDDIPAQLSKLAPAIQRGEIATVVIWIGINDLRPVCNVAYSDQALQALHNKMLANLENGIINLIEYGINAPDIYMVNQVDKSSMQSCPNETQHTEFVNSLNKQIELLSVTYRFNMLNYLDAIAELSKYTDDVKGDLLVDGEIVLNKACDNPNCFYVADGHSNTVANAIMANAVFADAIGVDVLSDDEIARAAGLK